MKQINKVKERMKFGRWIICKVEIGKGLPSPKNSWEPGQYKRSTTKLVILPTMK